MQRVHFGNLEHLAQSKDTEEPTVPFKSSVDYDHLNSQSDATYRARAEHQVNLDKVEQGRLKTKTAIPTDNFKIKSALRALFEPVTYFGECNADRRLRLQEIVSERMMEGEDVLSLIREEVEVEREEIVEEFFTHGSEELHLARKEILAFSIPRSIQRRNLHQKELEIPFESRKRTRHDFYTSLMDYEAVALQFGDDRPMGFCAFAPNSKLLATSSWSGVVKLWAVPESTQVASYKGHKDRVSGIAWHPEATIRQTASALGFASGSIDGSVHLWSLESESPIGSLVGHEMRVARLACHPNGRHIGTASFDTTWRLWDLETRQELLLQEGHSREVFAIGFQNDGALCATGYQFLNFRGLDSVGRIWDLRIGRSIMALRSHVKPILALDWSSNGYQLATAGEDNSIRIWDIRASECVYNVPAHSSLITTVKYWKSTDSFESDHYKDWSYSNNVLPLLDQSNAENTDMEVDSIMPNERNQDFDTEFSKRDQLDGSFLISSSYDSSCRLWTDGDYKPIKSLSGIEGKVMCADVSGDAKYVVTALYDRTFKLYHSAKVL